MKITDVKCAVLGTNPVVRVTTNEGISGLGAMESGRAYNREQVPFYKGRILGEDPTSVERVMMSIRRLGAFKPWGSVVSAIEMALWDIAGKAAGLPIHRLLGGKVRDKVRVYNGGLRFPMDGSSPEAYADNMARMKAADEGFTIIKQGVVFHSGMPTEVPNFFYGDRIGNAHYASRGPMTERGLKHVVSCVEAMKGGPGRRGRPGAGLRTGNGRLRCHQTRPGAGALQPDVARRHDHRRLHALRSGRSLSRGDAQHVDSDPHRRADLPATEFQGALREAGDKRRRTRPLRRRWSGGIEVGGPSTPTSTAS